ncbi:MAG: hypothetical protein HKN25_11780 [Pyrinomonadaceae bacterium]|nr:hypothetical protein [Pyrinomonadaceae bacterium]
MENQKSVILFFIDGLGLGEKNEFNPLSLSDDLEPLNNFHGVETAIQNDGILIPTDARLGVEGRPQSASGQTAIYTGLNAPKLNGGHKQGFPNEALKELIVEHSIFLQLKNRGINENIFANTYTPKFFEKKPRWKSATTCAVEAAEMRFRRLPDLIGRKSLFHDFTNDYLIEKGFDVPRFTPRDCGQILADLSKEYRFTLYEHFITDKIGHDRNYKWAADHLPKLAEFIRETLSLIDLDKTTFILTSDHGNVENLSIRNHTLNKVPTIVWGREKESVAGRIENLTDITPAIIDLLSE